MNGCGYCRAIEGYSQKMQLIGKSKHEDEQIKDVIEVLLPELEKEMKVRPLKSSFSFRRQRAFFSIVYDAAF